MSEINIKPLADRVVVPEDGEEVSFAPSQTEHPAPRPLPAPERPGFQKWLTGPFAGT